MTTAVIIMFLIMSVGLLTTGFILDTKLQEARKERDELRQSMAYVLKHFGEED